MFDCKVCQEKEALISVLKAQVEDYRKLVIPDQTSPYTVHPVALESDSILTGSQEVIDIALTEEEEKILIERDRLLSGNY